MRRQFWAIVLGGAALAAAACRGRAESQQQTVDWTAVERALGRPGSMQPGDVYKLGLPRSDLTVTVDGIRLKPALARMQVH